MNLNPQEHQEKQVPKAYVDVVLFSVCVFKPC